ncbi:pyruvate, phosphate dikinase [Parachlamydia acanthamoebae]|uniref:pyruvate, phosphate dikinase n=1 Tax=Parachlamydia acanthamoebae TaxID=83552 RepID=UPI000750BF5C|nr:pyruvate, phosphate dikinase [Parachlamydia acanthamoebae]
MTSPTWRTDRNAQMAYVFPFGEHIPSPPLDKNLLGGKGHGLAEMCALALPVPSGFIITTEACNVYRRNQKSLSNEIVEQIFHALQVLEKNTGSQFGSEKNPLLVSVRSGARVSMPGMMDTILNLGLNDASVAGFAEKMGNAKFAYDNYRRFIQMYGEVVDGVSRKQFDQTFEEIKRIEKVSSSQELEADGLKRTCIIFKQIYEDHCGKPFPQNPKEQLMRAIGAVFNSWDSERAVLYRHLHGYPDDWGTAVNVQRMVFGNKNERSATGVGFTRDPATGENMFYGEFLVSAQGEDVVAGIRTPHPINEYQRHVFHSSLESLEKLMPSVYQQLLSIVKKLEQHFHDMQDIEFTIEDGHLYMLQTRAGKRTGFAAIRIAAEMLDEGLIDEKTALKRVQPEQLTQILTPIFDSEVKKSAEQFLATKGLNAGPGAASGSLVFTSEKAVEMRRKGIPCILAREEASPDDFPGMVAAEGILTIRGGSTSHAAVVARGMGKPCVVGCSSLLYNDAAKTLSDGKQTIKEGDPIAIDGLTGEVFFCHLPTSASEIAQVLLAKTKKPEDSLLYQQYDKLMEIADRYSKIKVRMNADTPQDSEYGRLFGADGIGLCRTEHMFMDLNRLNDVRCMFFSIHPDERRLAIDRLLPHQKKDFIGIFRAMHGLPVTIRLLDPPLHEFMPHNEDELDTLAHIMKISRNRLVEIRNSLKELNPMLGHRGCRLGISYPELTEMQTRAILEAAIEVATDGMVVYPEIMVPLVGIENELIHQKALIDKIAHRVFLETGKSIPYLVGTMIELPRACLIADKIAEHADFFSFGTNDLTQTTFGISRDDSAKFVPLYVKGVVNPLEPTEVFQILKHDPFQNLDEEGVGVLMQKAIHKGRHVKPDLKCGICGEHGGDPQSIALCQKMGLNYVSCSPFRVPVARLAAAQASISE